MKLTPAVSGGLAGGLRLGRPPVVGLTTLAASDAQELIELLSAARADPAPPPSRRMPDEQSYTVTVEDGGTSEVLRRSDTTMSQEFAHLVERLQRLARGC